MKDDSKEALNSFPHPHAPLKLLSMPSGALKPFPHMGNVQGLVDISPTCVLDFYVVEGHQRGGWVILWGE